MCARSQHRLDLLNQIETEGIKGKQLTEEAGEQMVEEDNPLDGCLHVFIDLGSNRGLQIRKLYEPHTFPLAPIQPLYERFFGNPEERNLKEICSVWKQIVEFNLTTIFIFPGQF